MDKKVTPCKFEDWDDTQEPAVCQCTLVDDFDSNNRCGHTPDVTDCAAYVPVSPPEMVKPDGGLLLTDEEIWEAQVGNSDWDDKYKGRAVAKAQIAKMLKMVEGMELTDEEMYHMVEDYGWGRDTEERGFVLSVMDITSKAQLLKSQQHYEARIKELQHQLKRGCVDCEDALKAEAKAEAYKEIISEMKSRYKPLNGEVKQCDDCAAFILEVIKLKSGKPQEGE